MKEIVFEISLLKEQIACCLKPIDIKNCTLVSKRWNNWFAPALWRTVTLKNWDNRSLSHHNIQEFVSRHVQHIQTITILNRFALPEITLPSLPKLKSFTIQRADPAKLSQLVDFESAALRKVEIKEINLEETKASFYFVDLLKRATSLNHLDITIYGLVDLNLIQDIITSHGHLDTFKISFGRSKPGSELGSRILPIQQAIFQMENPRIKILHLDFFSDFQDTVFMYPLIRRCIQLEELKISSTRGHSFNPKSLMAVIKEGNHHHLRSLYFDLSWPVPEDKNDILMELGKINSEVDINGSKIVDGIKEIVLKSWKIDSPTQFPVQHFSNTLTSLQLERDHLNIRVIASLLGSLPLLQRYAGCINSDYDRNTLHLQKMYFTPWSCLDMKDFAISTRLFNHIDGYKYYLKLKCSVCEKFAEYLFSQLCRLRKLRRLKLGASGHCLSLKYGYLKRLSDLKEMRILDLSNYTNKRTVPSPMEVEWMVNHWPKLGTIYFPIALMCRMNLVTLDNREKMKRVRNDASDRLREICPDIDILVGSYEGPYYIE